MNGTELLNRFRAPLHRLAVLMAVAKYGNVPDIADRVGESRLALVQAAREWVPAPRRATFGYFVRFVLGQISGAIRHGAGYAKETSAAETSFVDLSEVVVERLEEPSRFGNEALWRLNNDTIVSTPKVIDLIMADGERVKVALARLHEEGTEATEEQLPMILLHTLTGLEEREMAPAPIWTGTPPGQEDVAHDLDATRIKRLDRNTGELTIEEVTGEQFTELVNAASRNSVVWDDESIEVMYDDRSDPPRYDINPATDNLDPEQCIPSRLWREMVQAFSGGGASVEDKENAIEALEKHWDRLEPDDPSKRRALYALAESVVSRDWDSIWKWGGITPAVRVYGVMRMMLELETPGGWEIPELPSLSAIRLPSEKWIGELEDHCWPSQFAGIVALALNRASPSQARAIEQQVYAETRF